MATNFQSTTLQDGADGAGGGYADLCREAYRFGCKCSSKGHTSSRRGDANGAGSARKVVLALMWLGGGVCVFLCARAPPRALMWLGEAIAMVYLRVKRALRKRAPCLCLKSPVKEPHDPQKSPTNTCDHRADEFRERGEGEREREGRQARQKAHKRSWRDRVCRYLIKEQRGDSTGVQVSGQ